MSSGYGFASFSGGVTWIGEPRQTKGRNGKKPQTVLNFSVAVSKDRFNNETQQWEQDAGGKYYESVTAFGRLADNIIKSLKPGSRVIVQGERDPKPDYTDSKGVEHQNENQVVAKSVGPDLSMWAWKEVRDGNNHESSSESSPRRTTARSTAPAARPAAQTTSSDSDDEDDDW